MDETRRSQRFIKVHLDNWRNFRHFELCLQRRAFLVGPNAAGKSNFLAAFRFLNHIVSIGGGFQDAIRHRGGLSAIRCLAARQMSNVGIRVEIGDEGTRKWSYELAFGQEEGKGKRVVVKRERVSNENGEIL